MRVSELADACRKRGLTVVEVSGWQTRGYEFPSRPDGALRHWTAGGPQDTSSLGVVTNGRGQPNPLPGPLANTYQSRRVDSNGLDIVYVIASGKANHAGAGTWNGISGNYKLLGLEIEWSGPNEAFANVRRRLLTSELIMRAMLDCCTGTTDTDVAEHREYATPKGRKIDTNLDGDAMRRRMTELRTPTSPEGDADLTPTQDAILNAISNRVDEIGKQVTAIRAIAVNTETRVSQLDAKVADLAADHDAG